MKEEYKQAPIGEIPKDWEVVKINQISEVRRGASPRPIGDPKYFSDKGRGWVRISDVTSTYKYLRKTSQYLSKIGERKSVEVNPGDLIMSICATIGKPIIVDMKACIHDGFVVFRNLSSRINTEFLFYVLQRNELKFINMKQIGTQGNLNTALVGKTYVPLPPLPEQKAIAKVLSTIDEAIQKVDDAIAKTEKLKKGLMQKLLTTGIGHKEFKDTEIGRIPKKWGIKKLEEVSTEVTIGVVNPATPYYTTPDKGVPYFRSQNVRENKLEPTDIYVEKEFNKKHHKSILKENDVLTVQTGFIGTSCLVPKIYEGSNCHSLLITRTNPKMLNPEFLCYILNSATGKNIIKRHNSGWGRNHLLLRDFRKIKIPLPPLPEQQKIADILSTVDKKLELERKRKEKLERVKKGLMNDLLTGKKRVNVEKVLGNG